MPAEGRRLVWSPVATNDLRNIWRYFIGVASPEIADRLLRDIQRAGERARQRPLTWRVRDDVMPGLRSILVNPYVVFYRLSGDAVEIVRVLHQRRNLAKVFPRVGLGKDTTLD
jgi:toxin ParE1/3/4